MSHYQLAPKIVAVHPEPGYSIRVEFADGVTVCFDVSPYIDRGCFKELKDLNYFKLVFVDDTGSVAWPHEQDFSRELIYDKGVRV